MNTLVNTPNVWNRDGPLFLPTALADSRQLVRTNGRRQVEAFEWPDLPGRCIGRDISRGEAAEAGLDAFIEQRYRQRVRGEGVGAIE